MNATAAHRTDPHDERRRQRPASGIIVTPEAVVIDLDTGGIATRLLGGLIDAVVRGGLFFVLTSMVVVTQLQHQIIVIYATIFFVILGYPIICETVFRGRTIGKMATGLRVVTTDGAPIHFRQAALRGMGGLADFFIPGFGLTGLLCVWTTHRNQRVGDMLAGTIVVRNGALEYSANAFWFQVPRGWEGYAETINPTAMRTDDYTLARTFLLRNTQLVGRARAQLAAEIASGLAKRLDHVIPPQVNPETFIVCALARYQRRNHPAGKLGFR
jgi:uncharacterized RDD family membrane protein YckC